MELKADIQEGEKWQKKLDEKDGIDRKKNIQQVRHSWQWNEELKGWRERKAKAKERFGAGVWLLQRGVVGLTHLARMLLQLMFTDSVTMSAFVLICSTGCTSPSCF
jgi:hypothetical protein